MGIQLLQYFMHSSI